MTRRVPFVLLVVLSGLLAFAPEAKAILRREIELTPENAGIHGFELEVNVGTSECMMSFKKLPSGLENDRDVILEIRDKESVVARCSLRPFDFGGKVYPAYSFGLSDKFLPNSVVWMSRHSPEYSDQFYKLNLRKWFPVSAGGER